jgi:hypothetical protein
VDSSNGKENMENIGSVSHVTIDDIRRSPSLKEFSTPKKPRMSQGSKSVTPKRPPMELSDLSARRNLIWDIWD